MDTAMEGAGDEADAVVVTRLAILFCDLRGYSRIATRLDPRRVHQLLGRYYRATTAAIEERRGTVVQLTGDEIFAVFGGGGDAGAAAAVAAARSLVALLPDLNRELVLRDLPPIGFGIGLHAGEVAVAPGRGAALTVVGDAVNVAHELCSWAADGTVILSEEVARRGGPAARPWRPRRALLKGGGSIAVGALRPGTSGPVVADPGVAVGGDRTMASVA